MILVQSESTGNYMKSHKIKKYFNVILNICRTSFIFFYKNAQIIDIIKYRAQKYIANKEIN